VEQLGSKDEQVRREAARTLATLAPPALEPLLIGFASSKDPTLKQFAPLALTNLATKASLSALAELMANSEPGTYENISAAEGLGKTHDASWLPLLLTTADRNGAMYLSYAAESGGETAIPALTARLRSADSNTRGAAIWALGQTGSRAAVPILIGLLTPHGGEQSAEGKNESIDANAALRQLTHLAAEQGEDGASIPSWHRRWEVWWQSSGRDAPIYKPEDCVEDKPLP
jgi:HEAT repeat protein